MVKRKLGDRVESSLKRVKQTSEGNQEKIALIKKLISQDKRFAFVVELKGIIFNYKFDVSSVYLPTLLRMNLQISVNDRSATIFFTRGGLAREKTKQTFTPELFEYMLLAGSIFLLDKYINKNIEFINFTTPKNVSELELQSIEQITSNIPHNLGPFIDYTVRKIVVLTKKIKTPEILPQNFSSELPPDVRNKVNNLFSNFSAFLAEKGLDFSYHLKSKHKHEIVLTINKPEPNTNFSQTIAEIMISEKPLLLDKSSEYGDAAENTIHIEFLEVDPNYRGLKLAEHLVCVASGLFQGIYPNKTKIFLEAADNAFLNYDVISELAESSPEERRIYYETNKHKFKLVNYYSEKFGFHPAFNLNFGGLFPMETTVGEFNEKCNAIGVPL